MSSVGCQWATVARSILRSIHVVSPDLFFWDTEGFLCHGDLNLNAVKGVTLSESLVSRQAFKRLGLSKHFILFRTHSLTILGTITFLLELLNSEREPVACCVEILGIRNQSNCVFRFGLVRKNCNELIVYRAQFM